MSKKGILRSARMIAVGHVRNTLKSVVEDARNNASDEHGVDLNILKPDMTKIYKDLIEWNKARSEESRLKREELKSIARDMYNETKRVLLDPNSKSDTDEEDLDAFFASLDAEFDELTGDDFDIGNESDDFNRNGEPCPELDMPNNEILTAMANSILFGIKHNSFRNMMISKNEYITELLTNNSNDTIQREIVDEYVTEIREESSDEVPSYVEELAEEIEEETSNINIQIAMSGNTNINVGVESENVGPKEMLYEVRDHVVKLLRTYQRNDIFSLSVDRIMMHISKISNLYLEEENVDKLTDNMESLLIKNDIIYMMSNVFNTGILDTISIYVLFNIFLNEDMLDLFDRVALSIEKGLPKAVKTYE